MKYEKIDTRLFIENRERLKKHLKKSSVLVLNSNDVFPTNADGVLPFKQNNDLFYFTGIEQEETIFVMCPDSGEERFREVLFIRNVNSDLITWEGEKLSEKQAREISGIQTVYRVSEFDNIFNYLAADAENVYLNTNEHRRPASEIETRNDKTCRNKEPEPGLPFVQEVLSSQRIAFLGLDVHDVGYFNEPLKPGMVLTNEPGIYIRNEGFGIRLENNIVITESGNIDLLENVPIEADEIDEIMNS